MVLLIFLGLLIKHLVDYDYEISDLCEKTFYIPCFLYNSRFSTKTDFAYSLTLSIFVGVGIILCLYAY